MDSDPRRMKQIGSVDYDKTDCDVESEDGSQPLGAPPASPVSLNQTNLAILDPTGTPQNDVSLSVLDFAPGLYLPDDRTDQEVEGTFRLFYGYTSPPPATQIPETQDSRRREMFFRLLGLRYHYSEAESSAFLLSKPYIPVQHLVNCILDQTNDFRGVWDLRDDDCTSPVRFRRRVGMIRRFQSNPEPAELSGNDLYDPTETFYVLEDSTFPAPWKLAFISASAALIACRLPDDFTPFDIAMWMVQRGVPFRCFYPASWLVPHSLAQPTRCFNIPVRPIYHVFTKEDCQSYVHVRTTILGHPHMQAALKRGGIVWRLAISTLGTSKVSQPPAFWHRTRRIILGGAGFEDDGLTLNELDLICGAYECVSSDGKQRSLRSWWPLARYYEKTECGENYGHCAQHGTSLIRTFHAVVEKASCDLLRQCPSTA
ncbi:hypothetical protein FA13DRAFT_1745647 [Coprinellus micaceus]|uniref:Uncharacterized protein n=1 Tax=Coprinellus micaceus TaxID=71717 RepID=A0A4Y7SBD2_COPMI|nr:hypothetical protein FA13DRAFT_1745647 [Coprinellus micaceus]